MQGAAGQEGPVARIAVLRMWGMWGRDGPASRHLDWATSHHQSNGLDFETSSNIRFYTFASRILEVQKSINPSFDDVVQDAFISICNGGSNCQPACLAANAKLGGSNDS